MFERGVESLCALPPKFVFAAGQEASESSEESKKVQDTQSDTEKSEDR